MATRSPIGTSIRPSCMPHFAAWSWSKDGSRGVGPAVVGLEVPEVVARPDEVDWDTARLELLPEPVAPRPVAHGPWVTESPDDQHLSGSPACAAVDGARTSADVTSTHASSDRTTPRP